MDSLAAAGSTWNGCGSHWRAKAMISSSVSGASVPSGMTCPSVKSSK